LITRRSGDFYETSDPAWSTRQADAFVNMLTVFLCGDKNSDASNDNYLVTVHVAQSALAGNNGRSALPIESVKRLCCDSQAVIITENDSGEPLSIGRRSRIIHVPWLQQPALLTLPPC
jgi:hypothetical protein